MQGVGESMTVFCVYKINVYDFQREKLGRFSFSLRYCAYVHFFFRF